jgi:hypothetical protein
MNPEAVAEAVGALADTLSTKLAVPARVTMDALMRQARIAGIMAAFWAVFFSVLCAILIKLTLKAAREDGWPWPVMVGLAILAFIAAGCSLDEAATALFNPGMVGDPQIHGDGQVTGSRTGASGDWRPPKSRSRRAGPAVAREGTNGVPSAGKTYSRTCDAHPEREAIGYICILLCENYESGSPRPDGYLQHHEWAACQMRAGLRQSQCPQCGKWLFPQERDGHESRCP